MIEKIWDGVSHPFTAYKVGDKYFDKKLAKIESDKVDPPVKEVMAYT